MDEERECRRPPPSSTLRTGQKQKEQKKYDRSLPRHVDFIHDFIQMTKAKIDARASSPPPLLLSLSRQWGR